MHGFLHWLIESIKELTPLSVFLIFFTPLFVSWFRSFLKDKYPDYLALVLALVLSSAVGLFVSLAMTDYYSIQYRGWLWFVTAFVGVGLGALFVHFIRLGEPDLPEKVTYKLDTKVAVAAGLFLPLFLVFVNGYFGEAQSVNQRLVIQGKELYKTRRRRGRAADGIKLQVSSWKAPDSTETLMYPNVRDYNSIEVGVTDVSFTVREGGLGINIIKDIAIDRKRVLGHWYQHGRNRGDVERFQSQALKKQRDHYAEIERELLELDASLKE